MATLPSMWLFGLTSLIVPEYPFGIGWMSFTSAALSKSRPFSSKNIASSAKYFLNGSRFPGATESNNSWVRRTSSSCVMFGPSATLPHATIEIAAKNSAAKNLFLTVPSVPLHLDVFIRMSKGVEAGFGFLITGPPDHERSPDLEYPPPPATQLGFQRTYSKHPKGIPEWRSFQRL